MRRSNAQFETYLRLAPQSNPCRSQTFQINLFYWSVPIVSHTPPTSCGVREVIWASSSHRRQVFNSTSPCRRRERREAAAKRRLADEYDAAQERGEVAKSGDTLPGVPKLNAGKGTAADVGLSRKEILEARSIRDAEKRDPGIVRRLALPFRRIGVRFGLRWLCAAYRIGRREGALKTLV